MVQEETIRSRITLDFIIKDTRWLPTTAENLTPKCLGGKKVSNDINRNMIRISNWTRPI